MAHRRERAEHRGIADEDVAATETLMQRRADLIDLGAVGEIERQQRRVAARGAHRVVDLLEAADRAGDQHDMRALGGEMPGDGGADAARRASDQRNGAG